MARWEPNARERLERAALDLFAQRGYDDTTVAEIAERAGLAKSTFFRHFTDKREVLFGRDELRLLFVEAITGAPSTATPIEAVARALDAVEAAALGPERREPALQRQTVIASNSELRERELLKLAMLTDAIATALRDRGVPDPTASIAAEVGSLAFRTTFVRWVDPANQRNFAELARQTLHELRAATVALS